VSSESWRPFSLVMRVGYSKTPDLTASAKATASPPERFARRRKVGPTVSLISLGRNEF